METRTVSLDSLFTDGLFEIPSYQRSYSWEEPQLEDLFEDLLYLPEDTSHFFGNVILDEQDGQSRTDQGRRFDVYDVVDGQQRLTTAMIFLQAAAERDGVVRETLSEDNLIFPMKERPRLLPQDQDEEYFRDCLFGDADINTETPSQSKLLAAYEYFQAEFDKLASDISIRELAERLRYDFQVNVVEIDGESEAASIFESLNDRGKDLSTLDKTKSFLMYMDDRSSETGALEDIIKQRFGSIYRDLFVLSTGHERVGDFDEDSFQRFHWGLYDGYDSNEYFSSFETLKSRLRDRYRAGEYEAVQTEIDNYVQDLREAASAFEAIFRPTARPPEVEESLLRILELGRLANVLPVLMASYLEFGDEDPDKMAAVVDACETLVYRMYAIDNRRADTGRGRLVVLAHDIHSEPSLDFQEIIARIDSITDYYTSDERFDRRLRDPEFYKTNTSRDTKYLLYYYGQEVEAEIGEEVLKNLSQILSSEFSVEHILAQNLGESNVPEDLLDEYDEYVHRLGNLTISSQYWNSSYGNLPFAEKKHATGDREKDYASSTLRVQRELADFDRFGKTEIMERQEQLIEFALEEWAIEPPTVVEEEPNHPENLAGYIPPDFFDGLTTKQDALLRILWETDEWMRTDDILQRMEDEYDISTSGSGTLSGVLAGLTNKHTKEFRRSIIKANWAGNQYQFRLNLDSGQEEQFTREYGQLVS